MAVFGHNLTLLAEQAQHLMQIRKVDIRTGDRLYVRTNNSLYVIQYVGNGNYLVSGGWFDRKGLSPLKTTITGCTWGGSVIKLDIAAACGLCLEFGNRVITTPVKKVWVVPLACNN
ncbi:MAG: hypothetical protein V3U73_04070 [bacterium]|jgi:hypothetical protein